MSESNVDGTANIDKDKTYFTALSLVTPANGYYVNGDSCEAVTYQGYLDETTGAIVYDETTAITSTDYIEFAAGDVWYFKTVITNPSDVITNTSLYIDVKYNDNISKTQLYIGVTSPTTRVKTFHSDTISSTDSDLSDVNIIRWIPVLAKNEISANITEYIEWYVFNNNSTDGMFQISNIVFTNN